LLVGEWRSTCDGALNVLLEIRCCQVARCLDYLRIVGSAVSVKRGFASARDLR
jgi:hypothetical protein